MGFIERVKKASHLIKKNWAPLLGLTLAYQAIDLGFMKVMGPVVSSGGLSSYYAFLFIVMWLVRVLFICGYVPMVVSCISGKKIMLSNYRSYLTRDRFLSFLFLDAIVMVVMIAGLLLLIVPGIYWAVVSSFSYFMVLSSDGPTDVIKTVTGSIEKTVGKRWQIFGYQAIYFVILFLAALHPLASLTVGVLATSLYWVILGLIFKESV